MKKLILIFLTCLGTKAFPTSPNDINQPKPANPNVIFHAMGDGACSIIYGAAALLSMNDIFDHYQKDETHQNIFALSVRLILMITSLDQARTKLVHFAKNLYHLIDQYSSAKAMPT